MIGESPEIKPHALTFSAYLVMQIEIAAICFGISAFIGRGGLFYQNMAALYGVPVSGQTADKRDFGEK